jgi:hypothetical protein
MHKKVICLYFLSRKFNFIDVLRLGIFNALHNYFSFPLE